MSRFSRKDLIEEVNDRTKSFREERGLKEVRENVTAKGFDVGSAILAGLIEDGDGFQTGVIVIREKAFLFEIDTTDSKKFAVWKELDPLILVEDFPATLEALKMSI